MKCAAELETVKEMVVSAKEQQEKLEALQRYEEACATAIIFCEEVIAPALEEKASQGKELYWSSERIKWSTDYFGHQIFYTCVLEETYRTVHHRNGTKSRKRDGYRTVYTSKAMDFETLKNYLAKYCFDCKRDSTIGFLKVSANSKCSK